MYYMNTIPDISSSLTSFRFGFIRAHVCRVISSTRHKHMASQSEYITYLMGPQHGMWRIQKIKQVTKQKSSMYQNTTFGIEIEHWQVLSGVNTLQDFVKFKSLAIKNSLQSGIFCYTLLHFLN